MTVADLIRGSLRTLGVLAASEPLAAGDEEDALVVLNELLDSWSTERLYVFATLRATATLTPSLSPHTIGTGGTISTTRPIRIDQASVILAAGGDERPLALLSDAEWQALTGKSTTGTPTALWVEAAYPLMRLHLNPIPNAADTLVLYTWQQLTRFLATSEDFDFPPGYARAIRTNLAKELAPSYGVSVSAELAMIAEEAKASLKRVNYQPSYLRADEAITRQRTSNFLVDGGP